MNSGIPDSPNETPTNNDPNWSASRLIGHGIWAYTLVSVGGFAVWALAGRWFYTHVGEAGLYLACTVVFLGLSGWLLHPLVAGPDSLMRFYKIFIPAFLGYAFAWCVCWFLLRFGAGEWLGSFFGCAAFALVLAGAFGNYHVLPAVIAVLFVTHSAGYFTGGFTMQHLPKSGAALLQGLSKQNVGVLAKLLWGVCYGAGFGAGIGYAFYAMQKQRVK